MRLVTFGDEGHHSFRFDGITGRQGRTRVHEAHHNGDAMVSWPWMASRNMERLRGTIIIVRAIIIVRTPKQSEMHPWIRGYRGKKSEIFSSRCLIPRSVPR